MRVRRKKPMQVARQVLRDFIGHVRSRGATSVAVEPNHDKRFALLKLLGVAASGGPPVELERAERSIAYLCVSGYSVADQAW